MVLCCEWFFAVNGALLWKYMQRQKKKIVIAASLLIGSPPQLFVDELIFHFYPDLSSDRFVPRRIRICINSCVNPLRFCIDTDRQRNAERPPKSYNGLRDRRKIFFCCSGSIIFRLNIISASLDCFLSCLFNILEVYTRYTEGNCQRVRKE